MRRIRYIFRYVKDLLFVDRRENKLQENCLKIRDYITRTQKQKKEFDVSGHRIRGLYEDLGKIKKESYQMEMHKKLDDLFKEPI